MLVGPKGLDMSDFDLGKTRAKIVADFALFSKYVFGLEPIEDKTTPTLKTNGDWIKYNPDFLAKCGPYDQYFKYLHEICHVFLAHHIRIRPEHDKETAQRAADYSCNGFLKLAGLIPPRDALYDSIYVGMTYEQVYEILMNTNDHKKWSEDFYGEVEPADFSEGDDSEDQGDQKRQGQKQEEKRQQALDEHAQQQVQAIQQGKLMGNMPAKLLRHLDKLVESETNWEDIFPDMLEDAFGMDDYTYMSPDKFYDTDIILPGMIGEERGVAVLVGDTSVSISTEQLKSMANKIVSLIAGAQPETTFVLWCDTEVHNPQVIDSFEEPDLKPKGGGGTSFRPPFEWVAEKGIEPTVLVYLTDGYSTRWPEEPDYPVIWMIWQDRDVIKPPFGDVIVMADELKK